MSTAKITVSDVPFELVQRAGKLREGRRKSTEPAPLLRDVYVEALEIGLKELEGRAKSAKKAS